MDRDLADLLAAWRGAEFDPDRGQQLLARLNQDDAFLREFVDEVRMLGMLRAVQSAEPRWLPLQEELGWGPEKSLTEEDLEEEVMRRLEDTPTPPRRGWRSWDWRAMAASVAVVVVTSTMILASVLALISSREGRRQAPVVAARPSGVKPEGELAVLTRLEGVVWETVDGRGPMEGTVLPPGPFRIREGRAVLAFFNGVALTVEGPADVDLISVDRVFCHRGRLRARVPKGADGFVVASAGSAVVDLGTEFGVNVDADGKSRVMVFEGAVKASIFDAQGAPRHTERVEPTKAIELDPRSGQVARKAGQPDSFVSASEHGGPALRLDPAYAGAVLRARPTGYWRFESMVGGAVPNEIGGGQPLRVNGPVGVAQRPQVNGYALFKPGAPDQFLTTDGLYELTRAPGYAVEFWFLSERISEAALVGFYPPPATVTEQFKYLHVLCVELTAHPRPSIEKPASVRFLHRWLGGAGLGYVDSNLLSRHSYRPGRWHHVVAQKDGGRIDLYFDGVRDYSMTLDKDAPNRLCRLVVGRRTADLSLADDSRPFVGRLDELAVYDHPLSADEVQQHFRLAGSAPRTK